MITLLLLMCGALSGFLAGLLGFGGGFVVVPALQLLLPRLGVDAAQVPTVAVATSLAAMVPTAMSAVVAQHRAQALRGEWVKLLAPGVALGSALGSLGASSIKGVWLTAFFALYAAVFAARILRAPAVAALPAPPVAVSRWVSTAAQWALGVAIGLVSALAGVGGASLVVPYLLKREAEMRQAAAAASAVGLVSAVVGATAFGFAPIAPPAPLVPLAGQAGTMIGFVCWPAALALGASAVAFAPAGVVVSQRLPVGRLRQVFALLLGAVALSAATRVVGQW